jgi:excinuclease ABC subunit C
VDMEFDLKEELKKIPAKPGCYLMHGEDDEIIYIGKAKVLCNRVRQYFQNTKKPSAKVEQMVSHVAWFEYIVTDSEMEAFVLEANLIKLHRPKYNTVMMDDKAYPYIRVTADEDFPRITMTRRRFRDKARYYGPYPVGINIGETLDLVHSLFGIRTCRRVLPRDIGKERPCLNYYIGRCCGPCTGKVSREDYAERIAGAENLLSGNYQKTVRGLEEKMKEASDSLEFEKAARYRDLAAQVKKAAEQQKITDSSSLDDRDVIACACEAENAVVQVFYVREGKMIGRDLFHITVAIDDTVSAILTDFVKQYYAGTPFIPGEILVQKELEDQEAIAGWLSQKRGKKVTIRMPQRGPRGYLMKMAEENARMVLEKDSEKLRREKERTAGAVHEIARLLDLPTVYRMEAYDISNTSGLESVGSMVVFEGGRPRKSDYRKFRIKTVQGPNDYASMTEVLTRRFTRGIEEQAEGMPENSFTRMPDLIMMDGGRGQVHMAEEVLRKLSLDIPVVGMVKDDRHRTRGLYYHDGEVPIDTHSEGFHLITRVQDEAHRFAITYHRGLRGKAQIHSVLDDIPGIGEKRRAGLMHTFGDIRAIRDAPVEDLAKAENMNRAAAESVWNFFHRPDTRDSSPGNGAD